MKRVLSQSDFDRFAARSPAIARHRMIAVSVTAPSAEPFELPAAVATALARPFRRIVVFSGAGMSADSGIPTFRSGNNGLWKEFDPQDLATPEAWRRDKETVWGWYEWRRGLVSKAQPNPGHVAVAQLQREFGASVVTQNVDDLHERAGVTRVIHLHGSLFAARCFACDEPHELGMPQAEAHRRLMPPRCARCDDHVRPGVVWFGESLPEEAVRQASTLMRQCDLLLVVGTSGVVHPAAGMVNLVPRGAPVIEINPQAGQRSSRIDHSLQTTAAIGLPAVLRRLRAPA